MMQLKHFDSHGITIDGDIKSWSKKNDFKKRFCSGSNYKGNRLFWCLKTTLTVYKGLGSFVDSKKINIDVMMEITYRNIIIISAVIATGSKPSSLPFAKIDKDRGLSLLLKL